MTVSSETNRKSFAGDGTTVSFGTSPIVFFDTSDMLVYVIDDATSVVTLLVENTNYTITGGDGAVGTVDLSGPGGSAYGAPAVGETLLLVRSVPALQETDFVNNDQSDAEVIETAFDLLTMLAQQAVDTLERSVRQSIADPSTADLILPVAADRANTLLGFDEDGNISMVPIASTAFSSLSVLSDLTVGGNTTLGNTSGDTLTVSSAAVTWSNNPTHSGNHTFSGNLSVNGNTTIGNASGDTLTVVAGTWTLSSNHTATRAAGTVAAGTVLLANWSSSFTGDSGGSTVALGHSFSLTAQGANAISQSRVVSITGAHSGSATITTHRGVLTTLSLSSTGGATSAFVYGSAFSLTSSGSVTVGTHYNAAAPTLSSTGVIALHIGFLASNLGHATLVTSAIGFDAANMTVSPSSTISFRSQQNAGTGAWAFISTGTANSALAAFLRIGSNVVPTVALDVTGAALISSTLGVTGTLSANTVAVLSGTTATVYNATATTVNAFGAGTTISMGAATGTLTVNNTTLAAKAGTFSTTVTVTGAFGCNTKAAQTAFASGGALNAYGAGANGFDTGANASALHALVVAMRAALVANGIMS